MTRIGIVALSGLALMLVACGSSQPLSINGFWIGQLNNPDGTPDIGFATNLTQGSGSAVNVTNFNIMSSLYREA
jgi:hypothetical protein